LTKVRSCTGVEACSEGCRREIVAALERRNSEAQAARLFDVGLSSVKRATRGRRDGGPLKLDDA
jgi:hypothetical protein